MPEEQFYAALHDPLTRATTNGIIQAAAPKGRPGANCRATDYPRGPAALAGVATDSGGRDRGARYEFGAGGAGTGVNPELAIGRRARGALVLVVLRHSIICFRPKRRILAILASFLCSFGGRSPPSILPSGGG